MRVTQRSAPALRTRNSADLELLPRLPETADEVRSIASALGADPASDVFLGRQANERVVTTTDLSNRRVVMFATHGLVPGDLDGRAEPALALTTPRVAGALETFLDECVAARLVHRDGAHHLALALPAPAGHAAG